MKRFVAASVLIVVTFAAAVVLAASSAGPRACTLAGCDDGISILVAKPSEPVKASRFVRFCAAGKCEQMRVGGRRALVQIPCPGFDGEGTVKLSGRVLGRRGNELSVARKTVNIRILEPNGHECGPTCWVGHTGFDVARGHFIPAKQAQELMHRRL